MNVAIDQQSGGSDFTESVSAYNRLQVEMLTIEQFAARMLVKRTTIYEWLKNGHLKAGRHYIRIGGTTRFIWGPDLFQKLLEDSIDSEKPVQTRKEEPLRQISVAPPVSRNKGAQIHLDY